MGNGGSSMFSPRIELYNSDTTHFHSYDLEEPLKKNGTKCVDPFTICINFACEMLGSNVTTCSIDDIFKLLKKHGIDGFKFSNVGISYKLNDSHYIKVANLITYLYIMNPPIIGGNASLYNFLEPFTNLTHLEIIISHISDMDINIWKHLTNYKFNYFKLIINNEYSKIDLTYFDNIYLLVKIVIENSIKIEFSDNIIKALIYKDSNKDLDKDLSLFELYKEKSGERILSIGTSMIDFANMTDKHITRFVSFISSSQDNISKYDTTIKIDNMKYPENLSRLFAYIKNNNISFHTLQIGNWYDTIKAADVIGPTKIHFWNSDVLKPIFDIIYEYSLQSKYILKEITSGFDAITNDELEALELHIKHLGLSISTKGIHTSDTKKKIQDNNKEDDQSPSSDSE